MRLNFPVKDPNEEAKCTERAVDSKDFSSFAASKSVFLWTHPPFAQLHTEIPNLLIMPRAQDSQSWIAQPRPFSIHHSHCASYILTISVEY